MNFFRHPAILLALGAGCVFAGEDSHVGAPVPGEAPAIPAGVAAIDEHLGLPVDLGLTFIAEDGREVALRDYFEKGRPVILNLVYYTCPNLCDLILNGETASIHEIPWTPGKEYEIVTISIDPSETNEIASKKKETYLRAFDRPAPGWHFLADHQGHAKTLAEQVGYHYRYDARQQQFVHPAAIMILTPEGRIARYLYGARFSPRDVRFALTEASEGRMTLSVDRILLWCYHYDPQANKYVLFASNAMRAGGALTVLIMGLFLGRMILVERQRTERRRLA
jgi:protein SCO1/2